MTSDNVFGEWERWGCGGGGGGGGGGGEGREYGVSGRGGCCGGGGGGDGELGGGGPLLRRKRLTTIRAAFARSLFGCVVISFDGFVTLRSSFVCVFCWGRECRGWEGGGGGGWGGILVGGSGEVFLFFSSGRSSFWRD